MAENQAADLLMQQKTMQSQVENSLSQSNEKMSNILQESRRLETERQQLVERTEKLKLAQNKILTLEKELAERKELLAATEK